MSLTRRQFVQTAITMTGAMTPLVAGAQTPPTPDPAGKPAPKLLHARPGLIHPAGAGGAELPVWAYEGTAPGPELRIRKGEELFARLINKLPQASSIHWHGVRGPNTIDGVSGLTQQPVAHGEQFEYRFVPPDAGTFVYHAHPAADLAGQYHRGLSGVLVVEEENPPDVDSELVLAIADWKLNSGGKLAAPLDDPSDAAGPGRIGSLITVNGKAVPQSRVLRPGSRVRLRIVNLCPARIIALQFSGLEPHVIAIDGQPCEAFVTGGGTVPAGPGSRFDVIADMPRQAGEPVRITMLSWPLPGRPPEAPRLIHSLEIAGTPVASRGSITSLPENPLLPKTIRLQDAKRLDLAIAPAPPAQARPGQFWTLNGRLHDGTSAPPLFKVQRGQPVSLGFVNRSAYPQAMRVHGHSVRLLHLLDDGWDPYWLDTVIVPPGKTARIAFIADNPGKWRLASAIMAHASGGLAHWFEVA
jgi:FtsP/CotA-like multicopper oxidase with cupredoxin domain